MTGLIPLDKEPGALSRRAAVDAARLFGERKVGHAGTLDPLASGVLPVLLGRACKLLPYLPKEKRYVCGMRFGCFTDTADITGRRIEENPKIPSEAEIRSVLPAFVGRIEQTPPMYAAVKVRGRHLYDYAREGKTVERRARTVEIYSISLEEYDAAAGTAVLDVRCSSGTYVRTLCEDIARALGAAAAMCSLRRTASAGIGIERCYSQAQLERLCGEGGLDRAVLGAEELLACLPDRTVPGEGEKYYRNGGVIREDRLNDSLAEGGLYRVYGASGAFFGLGGTEILPDGLHLKSLWLEEV